MPLGLGVFFIGYSLAYFGFCSVRGPGVGLLDLVIPGRTVIIPGSSSSSSSAIGPEGFPPGTTISPRPDGTQLVTPGGGGTPYLMVPVGGGNYSQEPLPPSQGGPNLGGPGSGQA